MKVEVLTLYPQIFENYTNVGLMGSSLSGERFELKVINWREYSKDKHKKVDSTLYGGGPGMLLRCEPLDIALKAVDRGGEKAKIFLTPDGELLNQEKVEELKEEEELILICGTYEGFDARIYELYPDSKKLSIGEYVISNGSLAALVVLDVLLRAKGLLLGNAESLNEESYVGGLLECGHYTKPRDYKGYKVPEVYLRGNHKEIERTRKQGAIYNTLSKRPDLIERRLFTMYELEILATYFERANKGNIGANRGK